MTLCTSCNEAELPDGQYLCTPDRITLYRILSRARDVLNTAGGTLTNQAVTPLNTGGGGGATTAGMPLNLDMLDKAHHYRGIIGDWAGQVAESLHQTAPLDVLNRAAWLSKLTEAIARHDWAGDMLAELWHAEQAIIQTADRHTAHRTLGTCGRLYLDDDGAVNICQGEIRGHEDAATARCQGCYAAHDVAQLIKDKLATTRHILMPLAKCVKYIRAAKVDVNYNTVKSWARRGPLVAAICDVRTRTELFTPADVVARMESKTSVSA